VLKDGLIFYFFVASLLDHAALSPIGSGQLTGI